MARAYRITADVGGTFTDVVVSDQEGHLHLGKAPTTRERVFDGLKDALASVCGPATENDVPALLAKSDLLIYATTHATNAIIERTTARTAFLVTEGFRDILLLREAGKSNPFDFRTPFPAPYVPRHLTFEIPERMDAEGRVVAPLDEDAARTTLRSLADKGVEAAGVCLLWSTVNPEHELRLAELLEEEAPDVAYTLGHQLNPVIREYRRASAAVIDASLKPLMGRHFRDMERDLDEAGFGGELLVATSMGGVMHVEDLAARPVYAVKSGPALAPIAARTYAAEEGLQGDAIVCDTGGTSFDVSLVQQDQVLFTRETWLGARYTGHLISLPSVDVRSIGSGGGSIAWVDPGGLLHVGPQSSGAEPGPACYRRGGTNPTVTDAAVVLGYLDADEFLGGRMQLDVNAAHAVLGQLAQELETSPAEAARAVLVVATEQMVTAIKDVTINEGIDPRDSVIVAGGGAAGLTIARIAEELGCSSVLVPRTAGGLSACGGQYTDIMMEVGRSLATTSREFDYAGVSAVLGDIDARLSEFADRLKDRGIGEFANSYFVEARYPYQAWDLEIPGCQNTQVTEEDARALSDAFHETHRRIFAVSEDGQDVEFSSWRGRLHGVLRKPPITAQSRNGSTGDPYRTQAAYFGAGAESDVPLYYGRTLGAKQRLVGPAIIVEPTTTIVVYPGWAATTGQSGYLLTPSGGAAGSNGKDDE